MTPEDPAEGESFMAMFVLHDDTVAEDPEALATLMRRIQRDGWREAARGCGAIPVGDEPPDVRLVRNGVGGEGFLDSNGNPLTHRYVICAIGKAIRP
jgi:hypothetical protein